MLRHLAIVAVTLCGGAVGGALAIAATLVACILADRDAGISDSSSGSMVQVGWVFCFLTAPIGALLLGYLSHRLAIRISKPSPRAPSKT